MTISRAEYERFLAREREQTQAITSLMLQNEWLLEQLKLSKKKLFDRSSEQAEQMVMDQLSLTVHELEAYAFGPKATAEKRIPGRPTSANSNPAMCWMSFLKGRLPR